MSSGKWRPSCLGLNVSMRLDCTKHNSPLLSGSSRFSRTSRASVPSSIKSSFVITPMVLAPWGSTSLAILRASEFAISEFAGDTARMRQLSREMNSNNMARICISISAGWSPTGTLVIPGRSIRVKLSTEILIMLYHIDGLWQDCSNSIALAMELL